MDHPNHLHLLPNLGLSLVLFFTIIVHCHSSQIEVDPSTDQQSGENVGGQSRFFSLSAGSKIYGGKSIIFLFSLHSWRVNQILLCFKKHFLSTKDNGIKSFFKLDEWMTFRPSSSQEQKILHCNWHFISLQRLNFDILKCKKWVILQWGSTPFIWSRFHVSKIRKWHVRGVGFNFFSFEKFKSERELNGLLESRLGQNRLECRVRDA